MNWRFKWSAALRRLKNRLPIGLQKGISDMLRFFRQLPCLPGDVEALGRIKGEIFAARTASRRVWYFAVPLHPNLGDQAQCLCIREWLDFAFPGAAVLSVPSRVFLRIPGLFLGWMSRTLVTDDPIVFQSGYTMTDFHPDEAVRRRVLKRFCQNPVLIFPQTILYRGKSGEKRSAEILRRCPRLLLLARDRKSLQTAEALCPGRAAWQPDMVSGWIGRYSSAERGERILLCLRRDGESLLTPERREHYLQLLKNLGPAELCDTQADGSCSDWGAAIEGLIRRFSHAGLVVTDRYHGMLFALAAGVPVIALPAGGHKVDGGARELAELCPGYVRIAGGEDELRKAATELLKAYLPPVPRQNDLFERLLELWKRAEKPRR